MPINDNKPTAFDAIINEVRKNVDEIFEAVRSDFNGPEAAEESPVAAEPSVPEAPAKEETEVIVLGLEAIHLLLKAEEAADKGDDVAARVYLDIADRYTNLISVAAHYGL